ncbi:PREDICTED: type I inositol 1,4,5-trisphosphate 5-phosphatase-like [Poecilia mexicana]|uniref:type I inositol 1,4,5-trisphosphate 5-phosphatase-like n=1 Tax=Poecilia mexicana TaxID=48701 RepID=UPI00072E7C7D|nr:PREDICTED: type I inositol 1,4,5-trisphosphate 5-phosphatase-like [Poecilia mexicana]
MAAQELKDYSRARVYIDESYESPERFTALGCFYFIHDSLKNVLEYNFEDARFHKVTGKEIRSIKQCKSPMAQKEKFPANFFEQCQWSRKGFIRTRWSLSSCNFDLVNVHLFHDAHNVVAWKESPSYYAGIRRKAMDFVLHRISDEQHEKLPFFLFGDFNFRLDTRELFEVSVLFVIRACFNGNSKCCQLHVDVERVLEGNCNIISDVFITDDEDSG